MSAPHHTVPPELERLLHRLAGPCTLLDLHTSGRTGQPVVWEVQAPGRERLFAKTYTSELTYRNEVTAYTSLLGPLGPGRTPRLLGHDDGARLIVTTAVPGRPLRHTPLTPELETEMYRQAGQLLALLHAQPLPPGPPPERPSWADERERALTEARELGFSQQDLESIAAASAVEPPQLPLAVCHGDYAPRNWIAAPDGSGGPRLVLIDFERTAVDEPARHDLMRVLHQITPTRPDLHEAFFTGYGRTPTDQERAACWAYAAIDCPSALQWAARHHDQEIHGYGLAMLDQLRRQAR